MNEESLDRLKYKLAKYHRNNSNNVQFHKLDVIALENLIKQYELEKEKLISLENTDVTIVYMNGFYEGEKKWKNKIKELLGENNGRN